MPLCLASADHYNDKQSSDVKETEASAYSSLIQNQDTEVGGSLSFTSRTRKFIQSRVDISSKATSLPSPSHSQDVDYLVDAIEEEGN